MKEWVLIRDLRTFSVKSEIVNILGFTESRHLFVATLQSCPNGIKVAIGNVEVANGCGCVPINLYLQKQVPELHTH